MLVLFTCSQLAPNHFFTYALEALESKRQLCTCLHWLQSVLTVCSVLRSDCAWMQVHLQGHLLTRLGEDLPPKKTSGIYWWGVSLQLGCSRSWMHCAECFHTLFTPGLCGQESWNREEVYLSCFYSTCSLACCGKTISILQKKTGFGLNFLP